MTNMTNATIEQVPVSTKPSIEVSPVLSAPEVQNIPVVESAESLAGHPQLGVTPPLDIKRDASEIIPVEIPNALQVSIGYPVSGDGGPAQIVVEKASRQPIPSNL